VPVLGSKTHTRGQCFASVFVNACPIARMIPPAEPVPDNLKLGQGAFKIPRSFLPRLSRPKSDARRGAIRSRAIASFVEVSGRILGKCLSAPRVKALRAEKRSAEGSRGMDVSGRGTGAGAWRRDRARIPLPRIMLQPEHFRPARLLSRSPWRSASALSPRRNGTRWHSCSTESVDVRQRCP
jgi:hypothetical protein